MQGLETFGFAERPERRLSLPASCDGEGSRACRLARNRLIFLAARPPQQGPAVPVMNSSALMGRRDWSPPQPGGAQAVGKTLGMWGGEQRVWGHPRGLGDVMRCLGTSQRLWGHCRRLGNTPPSLGTTRHVQSSCKGCASPRGTGVEWSRAGWASPSGNSPGEELAGTGHPGHPHGLRATPHPEGHSQGHPTALALSLSLSPPDIWHPQALAPTQRPKPPLPLGGAHTSHPRNVSLVPTTTGTSAVPLHRWGGQKAPQKTGAPQSKPRHNAETKQGWGSQSEPPGTGAGQGPFVTDSPVIKVSISSQPEVSSSRAGLGGHGDPNPIQAPMD